MSIPRKSSKIAHKVLQLLAFQNGMFQHIDVLAEALAVDVEQLSFNPEKRPIDRNALFEICTCLVTLTKNNYVIMAHYSVKEYLVSERIRLGPATSFQISDILSNFLAVKICLVYLLDITYEGSCSFKDYRRMTISQREEHRVNEKKSFPLLSKAITWDRYISNQAAHIRAAQGPDTALLDGLLIRLFNPKGLHYKKWKDRQKIHDYGHDKKISIGYLDWKSQPGAELALVFADACRYGLIETAKVILESNPNLAISGDLLEADFDYAWNDLNIFRAGTRLDLLDLAIFLFSEGFVDLLLDWGANPNGNSPDVFLEMKEYLVEKGGKSLKLYPGQNFQGRLEAKDSHLSLSKSRVSYIMN